MQKFTKDIKKRRKKFVDISLSFEPNPVTNDLALLTDERAINNSLKNIMLISINEVPFNRDFGSTIRDFLFDFVDEASADLVYDEVVRAITFNEPRVKLKKLKIDPQPDQNNFMATVEYIIKGYDEQSFTLQTILEPTR